MSGTDFEYAIKKDVRNNPIVREVDEARQRQLWRSTAIGAVLVLVLLFSVWQRVELLRHGYEMEQHAAGPGRGGRGEPAPPARDRDAAIAAADRGLATKKLHLVAPGRDQAIVIERVTAPTPPAKSIVAAR